MGVKSFLAHAWNAFTDQDDSFRGRGRDWGASYGVRPDRVRLRVAHERSILASIYNRIAMDVAAVEIRHVRNDDQDRFVEDLKSSGLYQCLTVEANADQTGRQLKQDAAMTMFDEGVIAIVATDTSIDPIMSGGFDILSLRIGRIVQWYPKHVRVDVYNENTGRREEVTLPKKSVCIVENPLYTVMNEPNSTFQRLIHKLNLLDSADEQAASGKLDMIIQLPYVVKSEGRRKQAEQRRKDVEFQLRDSKYGIAYIDGTEKITQLNRSLENNLLKQVEYLMQMVFSQLGITAEIMNGTADEAVMLNYNNRTVEPVVAAIVDEIKRKFLTKTARTQGHSIEAFRDPFKLVPMKDLAEMADKFTRNEIFTSNEFRSFLGVRPSTDPKADELRNSNMPQPEILEPVVEDTAEDDEDVFGDVNAALDDAFEVINSLSEGLNGE